MLCKVCGKQLSEKHRRRHAEYCSPVCSGKAARDRRFGPRPRIDSNTLSTGTLGAMHELLVCADLMDKGYNVFRAQSQSSPCDLIVMDGSKLYRVEVTTGIKNVNGRLLYPLHKKENYDVIAVVCHKGDITYIDGQSGLEWVWTPCGPTPQTV